MTRGLVRYLLVHVLGVSALLVLWLPSANLAAMSVDLSDYQWHNRLLFIFAPSSRVQGVESLRQVISRRKAAVLDRDVVVFFVFEVEGSEVDGRPLDARDVAALRRRFSVETGIAVMILVGKDGGEKLRVSLDEEISTVFRLIDEMPMRRQEMWDKRDRGEPVTSP